MYALWAVGVALFISFGLIVLRGAPYVPTHRSQLRSVFKEYGLSDDDMLVDLGAGDGVVLEIAEEQGASSVGYELNPWLWLIMKYRFRNSRLAHPVLADYQRVKALPPGTTVVYAFTTSMSISSIERCLKRWQQTSSFRFISYGFELSSYQPYRHSGPMHLYDFTR